MIGGGCSRLSQALFFPLRFSIPLFVWIGWNQIKRLGLSAISWIECIACVVGTPLVGQTKYSDIYITFDIKEDDTSTTSNNRSSNTRKHHSNDQHRKIPTLQEVARKVARLE
jgi:hypothetical protein